jgi:hypothetical protein
MKKFVDATLAWMFANLPPEEWTLQTYVEINWVGSKTVEEVVEDGELAADLPEELYPAPETRLIQ